MDNKVEIDDSLYSRQRYVLGDVAMKRMARSNVLLIGLGCLGVEIAKNIVLAGIQSLTLYDNVNGQSSDLYGQFYINENGFNRNRAEFSLNKIAELNPYVRVNAISTPQISAFDAQFLANYQCIIVTELSLNEQIQLNNLCHSLNKSFISCDVRGIFCWCFVDCGPNHEVWDVDDEEAKETLIAKITKSNPGIVTCVENQFHGLEDDHVVTFKEIEGMNQLNGTTHKIKVIDRCSFSIGDTSSLSDYLRNGIIKQVKQPKIFQHKTLSTTLNQPEILLADFGKFDTPPFLHVAMQALDQFKLKNGKYPSQNEQDVQQFIDICKQLKETNENLKSNNLPEKLLRKISLTSSGFLQPLATFLGGFVGQECIKALTGKFSPLTQWFYLDAEELFSDQLPISEYISSSNRYSSQIICIGNQTQQKINNLRVFMVGSGAIGCEMLKNLAMIGASSDQGRIILTDNDLIEKSNLNRQFLFRNKDIGSPKSVSAAREATFMNPQIKVDALLDRVGSATEEKFSDKFFQSLDVVVNALDNVAARLYVDSRCVANQKPLLESGTLGTKGHVQVIVPHQTESYGSQRDPPEKDVPFCTLKSFPSSIEHTIQWGRDFSFESIFVSKPTQFNKMFEEEGLVNKLQDWQSAISRYGSSLRHIAKMIERKPSNIADCISFARLKFQQYFYNSALQLLHAFPIDKMIDGTLFWTSPKRPPHPIVFDLNDPLHIAFIKSFVGIYSSVWGINGSITNEEISSVISNMKIPAFVPKENKKIETDEKAAKPTEQTPKQIGLEFENQQKAFMARIIDFHQKNSKTTLLPAQFEKDDDSNHHIDFIAATANLRARVYRIEENDRLKIKQIAGRIIPAIATTTSVVAGLVTLELIKIVQNQKIEAYRNSFLNLSLPLFAISEPLAASRSKITTDITFTLWDRWDVKLGDITLQQFINHFNEKYKLNVTGVFQEVTMIYVAVMPTHRRRLPNKMNKLLKFQVGTEYIDLIVSFSNEKSEDVNGPTVRYFLN
eukprot:TRINITY_DN1936_c2_g1_i2.p1 TRINITY_DN1936_c2_g1~~TRINITY_DN1936_c2_g1_i2.p1  ORF type:complete len:1019 (-),score=473.16 TRINITY_DN1936_c2_g1_i2:43-3066(-)